MASLGFFIVTSFRVIFALVVTHTTRGNTNTSDLGSPTIFPDCTTYNTSRDYLSDYSSKMDMQFHAIYFLGSGSGIFASGHLSSRFPSNHVIGGSMFCSSAFFLLLPYVFTLSSAGVFAIRFIQGLFEGLCFPALAVLVSSWALKHERSNILSIGMLGFYLSPAFSGIPGGACLCYISWDSAIYLYGTAGVMWAVIWTWISYPLPEDCPYVGEDERLKFAKESDAIMKGSELLAKHIPWREILMSKAVWAIWFCFFCMNFVKSTLITLQPQYYKDVYGMRAADVGLLLSIPHFLNSVLTFLISYLADYLITSTRLSTTMVRKLMQCSGATLQTIFFICMVFAIDWKSSFVFLTLAFAMCGISFSGHSCNMMDLSPQYTGAVSAVASTGMIGGVASTLTASLVAGSSDAADNWFIIIWLEIALASTSAAVYLLFASGERQDWGDGPESVKEDGNGHQASKEEEDQLLDSAKISSFSASGHLYSSIMSV